MDTSISAASKPATDVATESTPSIDMRPQRRDLMWRWDGENGQHILIGVPKTRSATMLNPVGARIFAMCDGETAVSAMVDKLTLAFPEAAERIADDVHRFLAYLRDLEVIDGYPE